MKFSVPQLRRMIEKKFAAREKILTKAIKETRDMTADEEKLAKKHEADGARLQKHLTTAEKLEKDRAKKSLPVGGVHSQGRRPKKVEKGIRFARMVRAVAATKGVAQHACDFAEERWKDEAICKALASGVGTAGGFLVPEEFSTEIIEFLRPASVVRSFGPLMLPLSGTLTIPKITSGTSAEYVGENTNAPKTEPSFGQVRLQAKTIRCLVPISNQLMRTESISTDRLIRGDLVRGVAQREDAAFIRDNGVGAVPKGLRYQAIAANVIAANGTINLVNVTNDLGRMELLLLNANVAMTNPGWIMAPRTAMYLRNLRDGNGNYAFPEMQNGQLRGKPYKTSTQVPTNLGGGSDESEITLADFADVVIAEDPNFRIDASTEAAYHDGSNVVSAFSLDQTVIRLLIEHDLGVRHDQAIAILTGVKWGAS